MKPKMTRAETIAYNKIDKLITEIHRTKCCGWTINIMDIGKVFAAGHHAAKNGLDIEQAVVDAAALLRVE